jgi:hypothetical protein
MPPVCPSRAQAAQCIQSDETCSSGKILVTQVRFSNWRNCIFNTMRAVRVKNGKGDADALYINENEPDPAAGPGQVLVNIKAFGLNRMDIMQREDKYPYPLLPESGDIMGVEFSGVVKAIGPECELKLGLTRTTDF